MIIYIILYLLYTVLKADAAFNSAILTASAKKITVSASKETFTKEHFDNYILQKDAAMKASTMFLEISPTLYSVIYPTYIYCEDYMSADSCLKVGCSWCNWPDKHCQYPVIVDLYPTTDYCITRQEI